MNPQLLLLDRVEFATIKIEGHDEGSFERDSTFPQLEFDFSKVAFMTRSSLGYPPTEASDPRHFALTYGVKINAEEQNNLTLPYSIEVEAVGFFRYVGGEEFQGADRFRAVRFSGYQILYGAIRELVCNLTARGRHGIWQLPARHFAAVAKKRSEEDEQERQELLKTTPTTKLTKRKRTALSTPAKTIKTTRTTKRKTSDNE